MAKKNIGKKRGQPAAKAALKRTYVSQSDVPGTPLSQALRIPRAIIENYGGHAATPIEVAEAIDMTPTSGNFRTLCGAAIAYGLTDGGYNANEISVSELGNRIFKPLEEGADLAAKREALLTPRIVREFLEKYDGSQLPMVGIARNVLEKMGVPEPRSEDVHDLILTEATELGLIRDIKGKRFVQLKGIKPQMMAKSAVHVEEELEQAVGMDSDIGSFAAPSFQPAMVPLRRARNNRVFVTHGKNRGLIPPIKKLLEFGQLQAVVSVEQQTVSKSIPEKVMDDMRSCAAAIIHVEDELRLTDEEGKEHVVLNPNVLIEIGAAMGLYGKAFILLVKDGAKLPSNLQGLFEVRYDGDTLDGDATIRLMEAINDLKKTSELLALS